MLQRLSSAVDIYLDRATKSREMAQTTVSENLHEFHGRMEASWMRLAASTAFVERVDLFLHTLERPVPPCDTCPRCTRLMRLRTLDAGAATHIFIFECTSCGFTAQREVQQTDPPDAATFPAHDPAEGER
jgi:hypothetical protein